jgi:hypothetical protein
MKSVVKTLMVLILSATLAGGTLAQDRGRDQGKGKSPEVPVERDKRKGGDDRRGGGGGGGGGGDKKGGDDRNRRGGKP